MYLLPRCCLRLSKVLAREMNPGQPSTVHDIMHELGFFLRSSETLGRAGPLTCAGVCAGDWRKSTGPKTCIKNGRLQVTRVTGLA